MCHFHQCASCEIIKHANKFPYFYDKKKKIVCYLDICLNCIAKRKNKVI